MIERHDVRRKARTFKSKIIRRTAFRNGAESVEGIRYSTAIRMSVPLPEGQIIPAVERLINGESFDFAQEGSYRDWAGELNRDGSPFVRIVADILSDTRPRPETERACGILADDLERFSPDSSLLRDKVLLKEWMYKLTLGVFAHPQIGVILQINNDLAKTGIGRYYEETQAQIDALRKTFSGLAINDLSYYIRFEDMFYFHGTRALLGTSYADISEVTHPKNRPATNQESKLVLSAFSSVKKDEDTLKKSLLDEDDRTWERLRSGWGVKEIQDVLHLLPNIRSSAVIDHVVCALEDNFFGFSEIAPQDRKEKLKIDPLGIIALLKWKDEYVYGGIYDIFAKAYPRVVLQLEENLEFTNFSVPRIHLPHTAILLLAEAAKRSDKTEFTNLIKSVQDNLGEEVNVPWFITLLVLRASNPETSEVIEQIVSGLDALPVSVREIFLSSLPGKLWLTKDGKLRSTDKRTMLLSAFPIFTSSKEDPEIITSKVSIPKKEEAKKPEAKAMVVGKTSNVPFFGEIGIPTEDADAKSIICLFEKQQSLDEEKLLDEFGKLSDGWRMADPDRNRNLLYIARLNASDDKLNEASEHGIEAVYIKGEEAVLIIRKDLAVANVSNKTIPIGLNGKIDKFGQFIIEGMDNSFVGEKEHLFLNNLVLHLALQPLLYKSGIPEEEDRELIREINKVTSSWNRSTLRGLLPKIDRKAEILNLALRIYGYKEAVLVGEKLK